jgi:hypothetical protein
MAIKWFLFPQKKPRKVLPFNPRVWEEKSGPNPFTVEDIITLTLLLAEAEPRSLSSRGAESEVNGNLPRHWQLIILIPRLIVIVA